MVDIGRRDRSSEAGSFLREILSDRTVLVAISAALTSVAMRIPTEVYPNPFEPLVQAAIALYVIAQLLGPRPPIAGPPALEAGHTVVIVLDYGTHPSVTE